MILKKKIIFGTIGFLFVGGAIALTIVIATSDDESELKAKSKTKLDVPKLASNSFKMSGTQTLGVFNLKSAVILAKEFELKYFVGTDAPTDDKSFNANKPSNLKNGDIVYIKPFIKKASINSYEFNAKVNPIKFVVSNLPLTTISSSLLIKDSFLISGSQTQGTIKKKTRITLPLEVEAKYYTGLDQPINESDYESSFPSALSNGEKVYIKFFIKSEFVSTHKLPTNFTNPVQFKVSNLIANNGKNVFQDSSGNIWAMGNGWRLQVLVKNRDGNYANAWINDNNRQGLLKDSIITDGYGGVIFEDSSGNIWAMGYGSPLQVLVKNRDGNYANAWISDSSQEWLLKDSNITNGYDGVIFEDSNGNIWAMGYGSPLQVLVKNRDGNYANAWISDSSQEGLLKDSNIVDGYGGVIFEDSNGNIWAMGSNTPLQLLRKERDEFANSWISDSSQEGLLKGSSITNGWEGAIFEDSSGNIWAMGYETPLQVLKKEENRFANTWNS